MRAVLTSILSLLDAVGALHAAPLRSGVGLQYRPGVMEGVARWSRISWVPGIQGFAAVRECSHLGDLVVARVGGRVGTWRVADCQRARDRPGLANWHNKGPVVIEVSYPVAVQDGWDWYYHGGRGWQPAAIYRYLPTTWTPPPWHWLAR